MTAYLAALWNWKIALLLVATFGIAMAPAVASQTHILQDHVKREKKPTKGLKQPPVRAMKANVRLFMTPSVSILFAFFLITTMATSGIQTFSIFTLVELHNVSHSTGTPVCKSQLSGFTYSRLQATFQIHVSHIRPSFMLQNPLATFQALDHRFQMQVL